MKYLSHLIIFGLALLALMGTNCTTGDCGDAEPTYIVYRCEPGTKTVQAYTVHAWDAGQASQYIDQGYGQQQQGNALNGKSCDDDEVKVARQETNTEGRPNSQSATIFVKQGASGLPSRRSPSPAASTTPTVTASPVTWFPYLAPLLSNPLWQPADTNRFPSTCSASMVSYLINHQQGTVTAFSLCPATVIKEIPVTSNPLQVQSMPDASMVLVTSFDGTLTFIDTVTNTVKGTVDLTNYNPSGLAISPDGTRAYVTHYASSLPVLLVIDIPNRKLLSTIALPQPFPRVAVMTPDGSQVWINYLTGAIITVVDVMTGTIASNISIGNQIDRGMVFNPTGTKAYVAVYPDQINVIDTSTFTVKTKLTVGPSPNDIVATPDGHRIFITSDNDPGFWWIDPTIDKVVGSWTPPGVTGGSMGLTVTYK